MNLKELESYLWGAAVYLRGVIDAGDYKQYIFPLLFYKRICDVYEEEYRTALEESDGDLDYASFAENHRFQVPEEVQWKNVRALTVNVGMNLRVLPVIGVTLPFYSAGGSSVLMLYICVGLVLSVYTHNTKKLFG